MATDDEFPDDDPLGVEESLGEPDLQMELLVEEPEDHLYNVRVSRGYSDTTEEQYKPEKQREAFLDSINRFLEQHTVASADTHVLERDDGKYVYEAHIFYTES